MNEKFPQNEREKLEAKLTALLLGELPAHEEAALHRAMDEDPELAGLYERLKVTIELMRLAAPKSDEGGSAASEQSAERAVRGAELKLPPEKRENLLAHFKTVRPKEFAEAPRKRVLFDNRRVRLVEWAAVAAVAVFFAAITIPNFVTSRSTSRKNTLINNLRLLDGAKQTWALEANASVNAIPSPAQVAPYFGRGGTVETDFSPIAMPGVKYVVGKVGEAPGIETSVSQARRWMGGQRIPQDRVHNGQVELSMGELMDQKFEQNPAPRVAMNTPWQTRFGQNITKSGPSEQSDSTLAFNQFSKGDSQVQDTSKLLEEVREARRAAIAKGGEERQSGSQPLTLREQEQTATFGFNSQSASSSAKTEIVLPSSNEAAGIGELALNEQRQTAALAFNGLATNFQVVSSTDNRENLASFSPQPVGTIGLDRNGTSITNGVAGEPGRVGILETPEQSRSTENGAVGRYPYVILQASNALAMRESELKTPTLGDIPSLGAVFRGGSTETNGQFYTGLSYDDVSGLRYLTTNGVLASQPIDGNGSTVLNWKSFDGTTNTTFSSGLVQNDGDLGLAATNSFAGGLTVQVGTLADNSQAAKDTERTRGTFAWAADTHNKAGNITLADGSVQQQSISDVRNRFQNSTNAVQNGFASAAPEAAPAAPQPTARDTERTRGESHGFTIVGPLPSNVGNANVTVDPNTHNLVILSDSGATTNEGIVLPQPGGGGGTGPAAQLPRRPVGGKQVEMAAAANPQGTFPETFGVKSVESDSNQNRAQGFDWYLGIQVMSNQTEIGGSIAAPPVRVLAEGLHPAAPVIPESLSAIEEAKSISQEQISTAQTVQDGKLLFQMGKLDEADGKLKEALARDPGNQSAIYYESLIKQKRAKEEVDARNVVGYVNVTNLGQSTVLAASPQTFTSETHNRVGPVASLTEEQALQVREQFQTNSPVVYSISNSDEAEKTELASAEQKLEAEKHWRELLKMKTGQEEVDKELPGTRMVTIVDPATVTGTEKPTFGAKLRETFSGKVERAATIIVDQEHPDVSGQQSAFSDGYDPYFLRTEFQVIKSDAVLKKAAEKLNSDKNGNAVNITVEKLKNDVDLWPVKNSKLIEIGARGETSEAAARIANAVAEAYKQYRSDEYEEIKAQGIKSLEDQVAEQDKKVELAQVQVDRLAKEFQASGATASAPATNQTDTALPKAAIAPPTPQPEILTRENAFSTFSMNVSDVSFKLAATSLEKGQMPEPASIRSEEFINAFDYRDPEAAPGVPVAFNYERALYPFAHNRELLRFSLKTAAAGRQAGRPLNIVLLLDNSGSMERADRVGIIQEALHVLAGQLQAQDTFSIVTFARTARLRVDGIPGNQAAAAAEEVGKFTPEGGTDLGNALDVAYETALHHYLPNGDNRVVMLTDGAANLGDVDANSLKQKVETHRKQGIALDCFGIGWEGYNDDLLEVLTRDGDGRYGFINTPEEASTEFVSQIAGALHVAAADVKVQVEFNPDRVISYRQIGYAKHQLTKEQFRDNTVAAGQIAAQEAGNALYTIEVNPQGQGSIGTVRVRYKVPDTGEVREQSWDVPYTGTAGSLEQASPAMRLATTASAFSEWLATSPFAEEVTTDQLLNYLSGVPQVYGADTRPQKLEWMIRQAKSISGK